MTVQWRSPPDVCCCHDSHDDTTDETVTTRLADHRPSRQLKESSSHRFTNHERLSRETRRRTKRQYNSVMNECLRDLHTSFTREDDVCWHWQLCLDWLNPPARPDIVRPVLKYNDVDQFNSVVCHSAWEFPVNLLCQLYHVPFQSCLGSHIYTVSGKKVSRDFLP